MKLIMEEWRGYLQKTAMMILAVLTILTACNTTTQQPRNAELTVTYFDDQIKHEKPTWTNEARLKEVLEKLEKKYLIFAADWCEPCRFLRRALREGELLYLVEFINIDDEWAFQIAQNYGINIVPMMFVLDSKNAIINTKIGPGQIVVHLLTQVPDK